MELYYQDKISAEEEQLTKDIEAVRLRATSKREQSRKADDLIAKFEEVAAILREPEIEQLWLNATDEERRVLIEELVEKVTVCPDHLEVSIHGAPPLNVTFSEVGLSESQIVGVGGGT